MQFVDCLSQLFLVFHLPSIMLLQFHHFHFQLKLGFLLEVKYQSRSLLVDVTCQYRILSVDMIFFRHLLKFSFPQSYILVTYFQFLYRLMLSQIAQVVHFSLCYRQLQLFLHFDWILKTLFPQQI